MKPVFKSPAFRKQYLMKTRTIPKPIVLFIALFLPLFMAGKKTSHSSGYAPLPYLHITKNLSLKKEDKLVSVAERIYESIGPDQYQISKNVFLLALKGFNELTEKGLLNKDSILSIVDFSKSSGEKRLVVIDLKNKEVLFHSLVAHGRGSGGEFAKSFSNKAGSHKSSLGFYVTTDTYYGSNGYSLRLKGYDKGFNDKAYNRAVVMHGADYAEESYMNKRGLLGRSYGCPAVPLKEHKQIINTIKKGSCLFVYYPDKKYLKLSKLLNG